MHSLQRVDAQCNLVVLREQSRKKQAQHAIEIENFKRSIDHDKRLKDFMRIKFDTQRVLAMDVFEAGRDETESGNGQTYEEAFHKIHEITKESDPDVLVRRFMEADDRKIALFSYVLEQTREIGRVQEDLEETKKKITLSYKECLHHEEDHQALVTKMKTELAEIQQETDGYRQKAKDMKMMQAQLHKGIDSMVTRIGCDRSRIENRLGNSAGVQSYNMMSYLRLMEQRISELLRIWSYIRLKPLELATESISKDSRWATETYLGSHRWKEEEEEKGKWRTNHVIDWKVRQPASFQSYRHGTVQNPGGTWH
ncbi:CC114 protein, partial [Polypterus senegalus]